MNKPNAHRAALTYMAAFVAWYHSEAPKGRKVARNALTATVVERFAVGSKVAEKVLPFQLAGMVEAGEAVCVRPRGPWGSGQGVMMVTSVNLHNGAEEVTIKGRDTRGHSFTRTYPRGINRVGFRVYRVKAL